MEDDDSQPTDAQTDTQPHSSDRKVEPEENPPIDAVLVEEEKLVVAPEEQVQSVPSQLDPPLDKLSNPPEDLKEEHVVSDSVSFKIEAKDTVMDTEVVQFKDASSPQEKAEKEAKAIKAFEEFMSTSKEKRMMRKILQKRLMTKSQMSASDLGDVHLDSEPGDSDSKEAMLKVKRKSQFAPGEAPSVEGTFVFGTVRMPKRRSHFQPGEKPSLFREGALEEGFAPKEKAENLIHVLDSIQNSIKKDELKLREDEAHSGTSLDIITKEPTAEDFKRERELFRVELKHAGIDSVKALDKTLVSKEKRDLREKASEPQKKLFAFGQTERALEDITQGSKLSLQDSLDHVTEYRKA